MSDSSENAPASLTAQWQYVEKLMSLGYEELSGRVGEDAMHDVVLPSGEKVSIHTLIQRDIANSECVWVSTEVKDKNSEIPWKSSFKITSDGDVDDDLTFI